MFRPIALLMTCALLMIVAPTSHAQDDTDFRFADLQIALGGDTLRGPIFQAQAGTTLQPYVGAYVCCYFIERVDTYPVRWTVDNPALATIDPDTGELSIAADAPNGAVIRIEAKHDESALSADIHLYDPDQNPLVGRWQELAQLDCDTGANILINDTIGELSFYADGTYYLTFTPFEVYVDYGGSYQFDTATGTLEMTMRGIYYSPTDFDGTAQFEFDTWGDLIIRGAWFGAAPFSDKQPLPLCGYRFTRDDSRMRYYYANHAPIFVAADVTTITGTVNYPSSNPDNAEPATLQLYHLDVMGETLVAKTVAVGGAFTFADLDSGLYRVTPTAPYFVTSGYPREAEGDRITFNMFLLRNDIEFGFADGVLSWDANPSAPEYSVELRRFGSNAGLLYDETLTEPRLELPADLAPGQYGVYVTISELAEAWYRFSIE